MGCGIVKKKDILVPPRKKTIILYPGQFVANLKGSIYSHYTIKNELGHGSYGRVVLAIHNITQVPRAMKIINKFAIQNETVRSKIMNEVEILKKLDHPNIIKIYEFHEDEFNLYLIMDLCTGGELLEAILKNGYLNEFQAAAYMKQILGAVIYLHNNHIMHRDLKLENMLLETETSGDLKLIDFGAATSFVPGKSLDFKIGTVNYLAPEVIKYKYTEKCDVWSCGVIMYVLVSGRLPFSTKVKAETLKMIQKGKYITSGGVWELISAEAKNLISKMLEVNPLKRITAQEAYSHPWIQSFESPIIKPNLLEVVSSNLKSFQETSKLQRAVIRFIASQLLTLTEKNELTSIFINLDTEGTGKITEDQLISYWKTIFGEELSKNDIHTIMSRIDTDNSGYLDYSEFLAAAMDRKKLLSSERLDQVFRAFDHDKNGKISAQELRKMLDYNQNLDIGVYASAIKDVDENSDGFVDYKEFKNMMFSLVS